MASVLAEIAKLISSDLAFLPFFGKYQGLSSICGLCNRENRTI